MAKSQPTITLPTLHPGQTKAFWFTRKNRFAAIRAGRRWGKTDFGKTVVADAALKGYPVCWAAPSYKILSEAFNELDVMLEPAMRNSSKMDGVQRLHTGGRIDFWTLDNESAGRSRKYKLIVMDEAAFTKPNMMNIWRKSLKPTLLDYKGSVVVLSNTNGVDPDNFFWQICNQEEHCFNNFHAPTHDNPYMPADELKELERTTHPLVWGQEYLADFVDWSGVAFFSVDKLLVNGVGADYPRNCDYVYAVIDTAVKDGKDNDGQAVMYFALSKHVGIPLTILDYDYQQMEGAMLEGWLPSVYRRLEELAGVCRARLGSAGAFIEDASAGAILLQQAAKRDWPAQPLKGALLAAGKDGRAMSVSGYVHQEKVKMSQFCFDKTLTFKGTTRNHALGQITGFRIGDKDAAKRADDLLDTFCYGVAIGLGNGEGF